MTEQESGKKQTGRAFNACMRTSSTAATWLAAGSTILGLAEPCAALMLIGLISVQYGTLIFGVLLPLVIGFGLRVSLSSTTCRFIVVAFVASAAQVALLLTFERSNASCFR